VRKSGSIPAPGIGLSSFEAFGKVREMNSVGIVGRGKVVAVILVTVSYKASNGMGNGGVHFRSDQADKQI
jgi:hypothetical protein